MKKILPIMLGFAVIFSLSTVFASDIQIQKPERPDSTVANVTDDLSNKVVNGVENLGDKAQNLASKAKDKVDNDIDELRNEVNETNDEIIATETKSELVELKEKSLKTLDDYNVAYGNKTYGLVAYILNIVRLYSIPLCFLGIAISAIYQHILGIRHIEARQKGFNSMIAIITVFVICQVLPLVFAIVVKGWRG